MSQCSSKLTLKKSQQLMAVVDFQQTLLKCTHSKCYKNFGSGREEPWGWYHGCTTKLFAFLRGRLESLLNIIVFLSWAPQIFMQCWKAFRVKPLFLHLIKDTNSMKGHATFFFKVQWYVIINRLGISKPSYNMVILLVPGICILGGFF